MSSLREQKIHLYSLRVTSCLLGMPLREKEEIRQEVRQHLAALIATQEYEGKSEVEAIEAALHQFGDPHKIRAEIARSWRKKRKNRIISERKAREAAKPIGQRRREQAVSWLSALVFGVSYYVLISTISTVGAQVWIRLGIISIVWGLISGFVRTIQPVDTELEAFQTVFQEQEEEAAKRSAHLWQLPRLPRSATLRQRLSRCFLRGMSNWARRYRQQLRQETAHPMPPIDWRKIIASTLWTTFALIVLSMLPLESFTKRLCIAMGLMWTVESISQRFWRRLIERWRISPQ